MRQPDFQARRPDGSFYYDQLYLSNFASLNVKDELARVKGVGDVSFLGPRDYSMRIWLDPQRLASLADDRRRRDPGHPGAERPGGRRAAGQPPVPRGPTCPSNWSSTPRAGSAARSSSTTSSSRPAPRARSSSSATSAARSVSDEHGRTVEKGVELGAKNYDVNSYLDGQPSVTLAVFQLPGSNALTTAEAIRAKMKELQAKFPGGHGYKIVYDTTVFVDESVHEVYKTLFEAFVLVFIVVLVFLQDWRATLMPMIDVPVSLIGTFGVMALLGFSLNNLTLFGLVLAIGIVVDDAIVVVENIERWMAKGLPPREATIKAMDEITGPVIAITLVLSSVFIPTAFLAGISGQFYRQFALTIAASTIISAINAMTMAPARAVTLIKPHTHDQEGHREALPRWGIAAAGRLASSYFLLAPRCSPCWASSAGGHGDEPSRRHPTASLASLWGSPPGALGGRRQRPAGWLVAPPINRVLNRFLAGFNWVFDRLSAGYGIAGPRPAPPGGRAAGGLRRPAGDDRPGLPGRAQGLHPRAGQGLPGRQRAACPTAPAWSAPTGSSRS